MDQDSSYADEDNLAFICFEHHDEYDSKTSQRKNFTQREAKAARAKLYEAIAGKQHILESRRSNASTWAIRYPGGLADVSAFPEGAGGIQRFAIAESIVVVNPSARNISLRVNLLIQYGVTQLAADRRKWRPQIGITYSKPSISEGIPCCSFPLNLSRGVFHRRPYRLPSVTGRRGQRRRGRDVPEQRSYTLEFEDLLSGEKKVVSVSAVYAPDPENHRRCSFTDLTRPMPQIVRVAGWSHFNLQQTINSGGLQLYENLIPDNFVAFSVPGLPQPHPV